MGTPTVSVDVLDTDSAIAEITNAEATGGIARGQGNDIVKTHHHGVSP